MEDVLEVYQRPYGHDEVLVCMDETSKQQVKETRVPRAQRPGTARVYDDEYERNGVSNLFMLFAPLEGETRNYWTCRRCFTFASLSHRIASASYERPMSSRIVPTKR